jgi:mannose-6-phosphate isomerase
MLLPIFLTANQPPDRFYSGGPAIAAFRSAPGGDTRVPEDWLGSTTTLFGEDKLGLSTLPDGTTLREVVNSNPLAWLGSQHVRCFAADTMMLVKLIDAGQRLPVHIHPDGDFAARSLGHTHGKAEAWIILRPGVVHLGFKRPISASELAGWVETQNSAAMLENMNTVEVLPGHVVYVPPGVPHAIGKGIFLVEVQEPEDLSILLEWNGFDIDGVTHGHLGLGFDVALTAADRSPWTEGELESLLCQDMSESGRLLPHAASQYFRVQYGRSTDQDLQTAGFSILVVIRGQGILETAPKKREIAPISFEVRTGDTVLVPYDFGDFRLLGDVESIRLQPPQAKGNSL